MANDAATLNGLLDIALRDTSDATWSSDEKDSLITQAVLECPPRPLLHDEHTATLTTGTYFYTLSPWVKTLSRIDLVDASGVEQGSIPGGLWEIHGDTYTGNAEVQIAPRVVDRWGTGATIRYIGYSEYDTSTHLIPTEYVRFVIAHAKAEAYSRMASDRARFKQWANDEQTLNISVNELVQMVNDAQLERDRERARIQRWRKPMPARLA